MVLLFRKRHPLMKTHEMIFLHKMLGISTFLGELKPCKLLLQGLGVNPFKESLRGMTSFQISCQRDNNQMIDFLTQFQFEYIDDGGKKFDLKRQIAKKNQIDKNSGIHYAALKDISRNFETIKNINEDILGDFNGRNWFPFECSRKEEIRESGKQYRKDEMREVLVQNKAKLVEESGRVKEAFGNLESNYVYAIICRDIQEDPEKTLVFEQLNRINKLIKDKETNKREVFAMNLLKKKKLLTQKTLEDEHVETIIIGGGGSDSEEDEDEEMREMKGGNARTFGGDLVQVEDSKTDMDMPESTPLLDPQEHKWKVFKGDVFNVKWVKLLDNQNKQRGYSRHCFLVGLVEEAMPEVADFLNLVIFNKKKGLPEPFTADKKMDFENFRDSQKQKMTLHLLEIEINLDDFQRRGIIEQYFPFHDYRRMHHINSSWKKERYRTIFDNLKVSETNKSCLIPFNALNFYHGSEVALYMGFNSVYTSWLMFMGIFGLICVCIQFGLNMEWDNPLLPIYAAIVSIAITLSQQFWERRQNEFAFLWNTLDYKENEQPRTKFLGHFSIDPLRRTIIVENQWPAYSRKYITDCLMAILGVGLIIANFVLFFFVNKEISDKKTAGKLTSNEAFYLSLASGAGNGSVVFIMDKVFRKVTESVIIWENHKYESDQIMSKVPKLFFFNFAMNYINLFFYAFYLQDFVVLQSNFISMFITKNLLHLGLMNILPWALYVLQRKLMMTRFKKERARRKRAFLSNLDIKGSSFEALSKTQQDHLITMETELLLWEMVEVSIIQPAPLPMEDIWLNYMLQFGFITFFSVTFPLAPLIGCIFNLIDMNFVFYSFSRVFKRETIVELDSIGVWNQVIHAMTIVSLIVNVTLFIWTSTAFEKLTHLKLSYAHLILLWVIYEHGVFIIKFILSLLIRSKPKWLREQLYFRKVKQQMYLETANQKKFNMKAMQNAEKSGRSATLTTLFSGIKKNKLVDIITSQHHKVKDFKPMTTIDEQAEKKEPEVFQEIQQSEFEEVKGEEVELLNPNKDLEDEEDEEEKFLTGFMRVDSVGFTQKVQNLDIHSLFGKNKFNGKGLGGLKGKVGHEGRLDEDSLEETLLNGEGERQED